jgi:hypothetical protein
MHPGDPRCRALAADRSVPMDMGDFQGQHRQADDEPRSAGNGLSLARRAAPASWASRECAGARGKSPCATAPPTAAGCRLPAAVNRTLGENPVEPVQQIDLIRGPRSELIIEAAAHYPEQPALPVDGQPRLLPIIATSQLPGCPVRKSRSTCNWLILRFKSSMSSVHRQPPAQCCHARATRSLHQLRLPGADHRRMDPKLRRQLRQGLLPR